MRLRIATRSSRLARWQADHVADLLRRVHPGVEVELVPVETTGDLRRDVTIAEIGGKGVFVKQVQVAVLDGRADLAVHSGKDMPAATPDGLTIAAVPERADPRDALVGARLDDLPPGATVATGSVRRRAQLAWHRPDLTFAELRGNVDTRVKAAERFGAVVLAVAGLERLGLGAHIAERLPTRMVVPQVAQGALAIECPVDRTDVRELLAAVEHAPSRRTFDAERAFLTELGGDCSLPAGAHATLDPAAPSADEADTDAAAAEVHICGFVSSLDGRTTLHAERRGDDPAACGKALASHLLGDLGGSALLEHG
ncbi:MAG: hydroxymethylbilane synthase [Actinomycetota bacterium]|nr:hydroxymethylbilane synthase [Actinomycetota bacterium]